MSKVCLIDGFHLTDQCNGPLRRVRCFLPVFLDDLLSRSSGDISPEADGTRLDVLVDSEWGGEGEAEAGWECLLVIEPVLEGREAFTSEAELEDKGEEPELEFVREEEAEWGDFWFLLE